MMLGNEDCRALGRWSVWVFDWYYGVEFLGGNGARVLECYDVRVLLGC